MDPFELSRFLTAQDRIYEEVLREIKSGQKRSHWMWFVFPQIRGLGSSAMAQRYAIKGLDEARSYLEHPILGARLAECTRIVNGLQGRSALQIFGVPDHLKFCSSMTLFELVAGTDSEFSLALNKYCSGKRDPATLGLLQASGAAGDKNGA